jgi:hypothetical protein
VQLQNAAEPDTGVCLHPTLAAFYAAKVAELQAALDQPDVRGQAIDNLHLLIERITLTPDDNARACT